MKIYSWNVNGIRAVLQKGFREFVENYSPDILCLQETKIAESDLTFDISHIPNYQSYFLSAEKKGYSGVAIYSKKEPLHITYGINDKEIDREGRVICAEYKDFFLINTYFPNSQRDHARLPYKLKFCDLIHKYCDSLSQKGKPVLLTGDYNIAHKPIDLRNPKQNEKNAGYLPEERAWMEQFLNSDYRDTFRLFHPDEGGHYTWWSYRPGVRENNIGWRLDYFIVHKNAQDRIQSAEIHPTVMGSDHCPVSIEWAQ